MEMMINIRSVSQMRIGEVSPKTILEQFSRLELRRLAEKLKVDSGWDKSDTIRNLINSNKFYVRIDISIDEGTLK